MPASISSPISTSPRSLAARRRSRCRPRRPRPRPGSARTPRSRRASSLTRLPSGCLVATGMITPRSVPQSSSRMITSWRDVDQPAGQVAGVGRPQRRVGQALAGTVRGDEVLQHGQTLAEVGLDRARDDLALRVGHQTAHAGDLTHLHHVAAGTGVDHHPDRVGPREVGLHLPRDLAGRLGPDLDELLPALVVGDQTALVLLLDLVGVLLVPVQDLRLVGGVTTSSMAMVIPARVAQWKPAP